jgi:aminoglycoside/choline kinase family phosphotransferase
MQSVHSAEPPDHHLRGWLSAHHFELLAAQPLPGDVSPRRYQRLTATDGATAILALYPAELLPALERFARSTGILDAAGVPVPRILAADGARGWMLLEDLGSVTLADLGDRPAPELAPYFAHAASLAARIAALPAAAVRDLNPPLDLALLRRELAQTRQAFLAPRGLMAEALAAALDALCAALADDPPVPCHRDFMARNLVPVAPGRVAVLDHQDLRLGPPAYDLASLLNDTLFPPPEVEERLVDAGARSATAESSTASRASADRLRYHRAAAQRTLKAVGTYAAFAQRGSDRHLHLIVPTLRRFLGHLSRVPEGESLSPELEHRWSAVLADPALGGL